MKSPRGGRDLLSFMCTLSLVSGTFVHIELWKITYIHSSSEAHGDQGSCRRELQLTVFLFGVK